MAGVTWLNTYRRDGRALPPDEPETILLLEGGFIAATASRDEEIVEDDENESHTETMSDINREEVKARLEASEARVATAVEGMRADAALLRGDLRVGLSEIKAQGEAMKSNSASFYAEARTLLAEIRLAQEQSRTAAYSIGYKVIVWAVGTVLALASVAIGGYNALKHSPAPPSQPSYVQPAAQPTAPDHK